MELFPRPKTKRELQELLKNGSIIPNNIDTSLITDMSYLFKNNTTFDKPINKWDTKNLTDMKCIFNGATSFNQKIAIESQELNKTAILLMAYKAQVQNYQLKY